MSNEERKIYDMVVRRFLAVMYPAYEYEESVLTGAVEGEHFYARGTRPLHMGWKAVYENQSEDEEEEELAATKKWQRHWEKPVDLERLLPGQILLKNCFPAFY